MPLYFAGASVESEKVLGNPAPKGSLGTREWFRPIRIVGSLNQ